MPEGRARQLSGGDSFLPSGEWSRGIGWPAAMTELSTTISPAVCADAPEMPTVLASRDTSPAAFVMTDFPGFGWRDRM